MIIYDLIQFVTQAALPGAGIDCPTCPASSFTAIGAAYATEGYYVQSDIIFQILNTDFGLWAPMLYVLAAFAGLIGVAIGSPPRTYMWFFMGPAIYAWLIDNTSQTHGVSWRIGNRVQDQAQVWKLAEAGLSNVNHGAWNSFRAYSNQEASQPAQVATVFLWFDELVSSTAQALTEWTGIHHQGGRGGNNTNLADRDPTMAEGKNYLMSNLKWGMVENITSANLHNVDLRDAFVTFMASECGDAFGASLDQGSVIAAQNTRGENLTSLSSVFPAAAGSTAGYKYQGLNSNLAPLYVPTPESLRRVLNHEANAVGSFQSFLGGIFGSASSPVLNETIDCRTYLTLITQGFRWEAGHIYHQLVSSAPNGVSPEDIVYNLFYGWDIKTGRSASGSGGQTLTTEQYASFLMDLILIHLYRNEMEIAPQAMDGKYSTSQKAEKYVNSYSRTTGSRGKYGEVYSWALMIPHIQGILLYLLAAGYPIAAMLIVIPGMHKSILTWAKFWFWVKMWDVGFAVVMVLERSVWAMIGNGSNSSKIFDLVTEMRQWGQVAVSCPSGGAGSGTASRLCPVPSVLSADGATANFSFGPFGYPIFSGFTSRPQSLENMYKTLDRSMVLSANLDLDLANSYYIYIMAALYFAVPAVTGQVILGAHAGASSLINSAVGGIAQETGKLAGSGLGSEGVTRMSANMASTGQAAYAKSLRQSGLGMQAISYGNQSAREGDTGMGISTFSGGLDLKNDNRARTFQTAIAAGDVMNAGAGAVQTTANNTLAESRRARGQGRGAVAAGGGSLPVLPASAASGEGKNMAEAAASPSNLDGSAGAPGMKSGGAGDTGDKPDGAGAAGTNSRTPIAAPAGAAAAGAGGSTRGGTGGGGGAGAGAPRRVDGKPPSKFQPSDFGKGALQSLSSIAGAGVRDWTADEQRKGLEYGAQINAAKADLGIAGYGANARARAYEMAGSRMGQHAGFEAQQAEWSARNAFAAQITGNAVALGHFVGGMSAGNKPTGSAEAMAMSGMLNTPRQDAKSAAYWSDPIRGQRFGNIEASQARLSGEVGGDKVAAQFTSYGFKLGFGDVRAGAAAKALASETSGAQVHNRSDNPAKGNLADIVARNNER